METRDKRLSSVEPQEMANGSPRLRIKLEHPRLAALSYIGLGLFLVLAVASGDWELLAAILTALLFIGLLLLQRTEWKGYPLTHSSFGPSVFREGLRVLPRDVLLLSYLVLGFVPVLLLAVFVWETWMWVEWAAVGWSAAVSAGALIALVIESRRRQSGSG